MINDIMIVRGLMERSADANLLRLMIRFAAERRKELAARATFGSAATPALITAGPPEKLRRKASFRSRTRCGYAAAGEAVMTSAQPLARAGRQQPEFLASAGDFAVVGKVAPAQHE